MTEPNKNWLYSNLRYRRKVASNTNDEKLQLGTPGWNVITDDTKSFWRKIIWSSVVVTCFLICAYQICERIALFASNPISTMVLIRKNDSVKYPSYTICPTFDRMQTLLPLRERIAKEKNIGLCKVSLSDIARRFNASFFDHLPNLTIDSIIESTTLTKPLYSNYSYAILEENVTTLFGVCRKLSFPELVPYQTQSYAVEIISIPVYRYLRCAPFDAAPYNVFMRSDDNPIKYHYYPSIAAEDNTEGVYGVTARQFTFLNTIDQPCADVATLNLCRDKCLNEYFLNKTTCRLPHQRHFDLPACTFDNAVWYDAFTLALFGPNEINYELDCGCPRLCEEINYSINYKAAKPSNDKRKRNRASIEIHFDDNAIDVIMEYYSYTVIQLLCDVGGNLGLFLGLCIPTMLEMSENGLAYLKSKLV